MASLHAPSKELIPEKDLEEIRRLLWGSDIKYDVFRRWTQGVEFSDDEPSALLQYEGGPCAVIAPLQAFLLKNILFSNGKSTGENWRKLNTSKERDELLCHAVADMLSLMTSTRGHVYMVSHTPKKATKDQCSVSLNNDQTCASSSSQVSSHQASSGTYTANVSSVHVDTLHETSHCSNSDNDIPPPIPPRGVSLLSNTCTPLRDAPHLLTKDSSGMTQRDGLGVSPQSPSTSPCSQTATSITTTDRSQQSMSPNDPRPLPMQDIADEHCDVKKKCLSHEEFHSGLSCTRCSSNRDDIVNYLHDHHLPALQREYGILLLLYSVILTKRIEQIKNELEDIADTLIDPTFGHGSQSLINLLMTGKAVSNVWDNEKDVSGLKLKGISEQSTIGFLTQLEHLRYCEVGWYLKNPLYPVWLLGSETHLTVLFSQNQNLISSESAEMKARRTFASFDVEGCGFVSGEKLGELMEVLGLVSDPDYVKFMLEKLDPEQLGIITLNGFLDEFYQSEPQSEPVNRFNLLHYNGLCRSCPGNKVMYLEARAEIMDTPELQIITDSSPIKTCLMTKWPTIELHWANNIIPSLN